MRQQDRRSLHKQAGRSPLPKTDRVSGTDSQMVRRSRRKDPGHICPGDPERPSRPVVAQGSDSRERMVATPQGRSRDLVEVGNPPHGSVCHGTQPQTTGLRVSVSRSSSVRHGRPCVELGRSGSLCLSAPLNDQGCDPKDQVAHLSHYPHRPLVAEERMDNRPSGSQRRAASAAPTVANTPGAARDEQVPRGTQCTQPSRMEVITQHVRAKGFSDPVSSRIARGGLRNSSLTVYTARWNIFSAWCRERQLNPWSGSITDIADFLYYQWAVLEKASSTIEGFRTAISNTLANVLGFSVGLDSDLKALVASFYTDRPAGRQVLPRWDLPLVLSMLRLPPFENLENPSRVDLKFLTWKTCFLLTLASGARRSEIHALAFDRIQWSRDRRRVTLRPCMGFMAKNHVARDPSTAFSGFSLTAMDEGLPLYERALCPVRALRLYLQRTERVRGDRNALFLPLTSKPDGSVCRNTISSWIKQTILMAYETAGSDANPLQLVSARAHEVRAFSASWRALRMVAVADILQACRWRSTTTFAEHYLRDLTVLEAGMFAFAGFEGSLA